jgi:YHS domain-containing protein
MRGLVSFLLFAALFFFMMRFGCGAHAAHGGHGQRARAPGGPGGDGQPRRPEGDQRDPVCGMQVPLAGGYAKVHESREYRFCSRECLDKFEANPSSYTQQASTPHSHGGHAT